MVWPPFVLAIVASENFPPLMKILNTPLLPSEVILYYSLVYIARTTASLAVTYFVARIAITTKHALTTEISSDFQQYNLTVL